MLNVISPAEKHLFSNTTQGTHIHLVGLLNNKYCFSAPPIMQRNWKPPASGRTSEESVPVGPPTQLNRNQLLAETLHIARPIAHCILYKQLHNKAFQSNPAVRLPIGPWGFFWGWRGEFPMWCGEAGV